MMRWPAINISRPLNIDLYQQICCEKTYPLIHWFQRHPHQSFQQNQHCQKLSTRFWNVYKWYIFPIDWWFCAMVNFSNETIFSSRYFQHTKRSRRRFDKKFFRFCYFHTFSILLFHPHIHRIKQIDSIWMINQMQKTFFLAHLFTRSYAAECKFYEL